MEKINKRSMRLLWLPLLLILPACLLACVFMLFINFLGFVFLAVALGCLAFAQVYRIYFYYQLSLDVNAVCEGDGLECASYLYVMALNTVTFGIYGKFWVYKVAQRLQANAPRYGFKMMVGGKEMVVLDLLSGGWISAWEFVRNMNKFARVYNAEGLPEVVGGVQ